MIAKSSANTNSEQPLNSLAAIFDALLRHKKRAIAPFVAIVGITGVVILLLPKVYLSEAKLFVRVGRESIGLDPTATTGQTISVYESRESEINSVLDLLGSRVLLEKVVAEVGAAEVLNTSGKSAASEEQAIRLLAQNIQTDHAKKSSVITVSCKARSPKLAQRITQVFVDSFLTEHLRVHRTAGSFEFFQQQKTLLSNQLATASQDLGLAKNDIGLISVVGQRKLIQDKMNILHTAQLTTETNLAASRANIVALTKLIETMPAQKVTQEVSGFFNDAADQTKQRLYQLRLREQELLTKFTPQHPRVVAIREQIAAASSILAEPNAGSAQATTASNPAYEQTQLSLLKEKAMAQSLQAKLDKLAEQESELTEQLATLNTNEALITQKQKQVDRLQKSYEAYSERSELARIDQALEEEHISNVNIAQPPTFVSKPVGPKRRVIGLLGLIVACLTALIAALGTEYWNWFKPQLADQRQRSMSPEPNRGVDVERRSDSIPAQLT